MSIKCMEMLDNAVICERCPAFGFSNPLSSIEHLEMGELVHIRKRYSTL